MAEDNSHQFQPGNKLWQMRSKDGKEPKYNPDELWDKAVKYFEWVEKNPLKEMQLFAYQGKVTKEEVPKMRAMTYQGLQLFLDISQKTWDNYTKKDDDYILITSAIKKIIYEQKFSGAAATLLNPNIIARDLGLTDSQKHEHSGEITDTKQINITIGGKNIDLGEYKEDGSKSTS